MGEKQRVLISTILGHFDNFGKNFQEMSLTQGSIFRTSTSHHRCRMPRRKNSQLYTVPALGYWRSKSKLSVNILQFSDVILQFTDVNSFKNSTVVLS